MIYDIEGTEPKSALSAYFAARAQSGNWRGKKQWLDPSDLERRDAAFSRKVDGVVEAIQAGVARIRVDDSCDAGMLSVRYLSGERLHIPASGIPDDLHKKIIGELTGASSANWTVN
jgi:hypothetical protein